MSSKIQKILLGIALISLVSSAVWAQALFATLTGIVSDPSGAVVAGAKITLTNAQSGSQRVSQTDSSGYYTFSAVDVGTYNVTIDAPGFNSFKEEGVSLGGGQNIKVNATLQVGSTNQTVEVTGSADIITPEDSGEKSSVLTTDQLQNYVQTGSNAAEYIKIMPGFGNQNGTQNKANYTGQTIGINANGDSGSQSPLNNAFSYNGLPGNTLDIVADGAHVSDPGCNCDTPVNPNSDFIQEIRVLSSNFNAEEQKGPMVITSITKAGGSQFHGEGFFTARNYVLNSNDAYANATGVKQPHDKYYYPGGEIGGPVLIPWTNFNKNRDKLFFFTGYEYFYQTIDTGVLTATVPTPGEIGGNFCPSEIAKEGTAPNGRAPQPVYFNGGATCQMPANLIDPSMQALMKLYPSPNANGSNYNYSQAEIFQQNNWQWTTRGDWNVSDNTKVFVRYNMQREQQPFPVGLWWRNGDQVPYPTPVIGKNRSDSVTGTITHVFSPTMTNETVFAYTFVGFPNVFQNPAKVNPSKVGFTDKLIYQNAATASQIPSFGQYGPSEAAFIFNPGGFEAGGPSAGLYANKYMPSVSDTLTKVVGTHTVKGGFFYEWIRNAQPANNFTNGLLQFDPTSSFSTGNAYADMLEGNLSGFSQTNFNRINDISYNTDEFFLQDDWKVTSRLTLDYGIRFTHFTPWTDDEGYGYSVFIPSQYQGSSCTGSPTFCGFQWHARDKAIPLTGFPSRALFYQPRFGLAYDIFGSGKTVVRGGWGRFYYHSGQFTSGLDTAAGSASVSVGPGQAVGGALYVKNLSSVPANAAVPAPTAVDARDSKQPYTDSYSFSIDQRTPWKGLLELSYVGNQSSELPVTGGYGSNINLIKPGTITDANSNGNAGTANTNLFRPYQGYGDLNIVTNLAYSNYNAFQATWAHQGARSTLQLNYTYGKSLGIINPGSTILGGSGGILDPFNLRNNYGLQPGDRRQLFNAAYSFNMGTYYHGNKFVGGVINGWQISGITQWESGFNITDISGGGNYSMTYNGVGSATPCPTAALAAGAAYPTVCGSTAIIPGSVSATNLTGIPINNVSLLGTNAIQLNPIQTCDPGKGLGPHSWINGNCFSVPTTPGANGATLLPAIYGPAFFNSDLGIFKNFQISESKKLQFRVQAQNFLNHPLWSFPTNNPLSLQFTQQPDGTFKQTNSQFGTAQFKQGQRIVEMVVKFYF